MTAAKDKPKRKKQEPIPIVGVRGSSTKVSVPKAVLAGGAAIIATSKHKGIGSPVDIATGKTLSAPGPDQGTGIGPAARQFLENARDAVSSPNGRVGVGILLGGLIFGKAIDRRYPDLPIRLGR